MQNFFFLIIAISKCMRKRNTPIARYQLEFIFEDPIATISSPLIMRLTRFPRAIGMLRFRMHLLIAIKRKKKFCIKCLALAVFAFSVFFWLRRQALLKSPKGRNASRDDLDKFKIFGFGIVFATFAIIL